jgi:hypothetical protein
MAEKLTVKVPAYALIENLRSVVLPTDVAMQVFTLLCQGEQVTFDWQTKAYKRDTEYAPTLKVFTLRDHASLALNDD